MSSGTATTPGGLGLADFTVSRQAPVSREEAARLAADLAPDADWVLKATGSLCPDCVAEGRYDDLLVPMVVYEQDGEVRLAKECPNHGEMRDVYWRDADLYDRARRWADEDNRLETYHHIPEGQAACPIDCGLCPRHKSHTGLGTITVTNRCDLSCWYSFFYAREDDPLYEPTKAQSREMAEAMADEAPIGCNAIRITGGEPTMREDIVGVMEVVNDVVDHVQFNTHSGIRAGDVELARDLRDAGVNTIYSSFDGVEPKTNPKNYWAMPEAIRTYRRADLPVVLVPTIIGGRNDDQLGDSFGSPPPTSTWFAG